MLTEQTLQRMMPAAGARLDDHLPYIVPATVEGRCEGQFFKGVGFLRRHRSARSH